MNRAKVHMASSLCHSLVRSVICSVMNSKLMCATQQCFIVAM